VGVFISFSGHGWARNVVEEGEELRLGGGEGEAGGVVVVVVCVVLALRKGRHGFDVDGVCAVQHTWG